MISPIQFIRITQYDNLYAGMDDGQDKFLSIAAYDGGTGTLPTAVNVFKKGCILVHFTDGVMYQNSAADGAAPSWVGPFTGVIPALADGAIFVGQGGTATVQVPGGDVTMTNAGVFTVVAIQNIPVSATPPIEGQVLTYDGTEIISRPGVVLLATLSGFDFNSTADQAFAISASLGDFIITDMVIGNASGALTTADGFALWSGAAQTGDQFGAMGNPSLVKLAAATNFVSLLQEVAASTSGASVFNNITQSPGSVIASVATPEGAPLTADILLFGYAF